MKKQNVSIIEKLAQTFSDQNVKYRFIDHRWKERGDVDIIVSKKSIKKFENILHKNGFKRKGFWPPQSRMYKGFCNNEIISIGAHVGGYIGGFGGGLGRLGKIFSPKVVTSYKESYLSFEEQIFILIYKYGSRKNKLRYVKEYERLAKKKLDYKKLYQVCSKAFTNAKEIVSAVKQREKLDSIVLHFTLRQHLALFFRGKPNKILRRIYKFVFPAPYIAFVGCNGVGKSTMVKNLTKKLKDENLEVAHVYSGRIHFQMLPINAIVKLFKPNKIEGKKNLPGSKEKYAREVRIFTSPTLNFVAPFVYYLEYLLRYFFKIHPHRIFNDVVVTDRSFIDVFTSPNMNKKICTFLNYFLPQPRYILLWNDPETIAKRRPEFLVKRIEHQLKTYNNLRLSYILKIKTDSLDVVNTIAKKIEKLL